LEEKEKEEVFLPYLVDQGEENWRRLGFANNKERI